MNRQDVEQSIDFKGRELELHEANYAAMIVRREQMRSELTVLEIDIMQTAAYVRQLKAQKASLEALLKKAEIDNHGGR